MKYLAAAASLLALHKAALAATFTDEAGAATSTDVNAECAAYYYAPVSQLLTSLPYPPIWQIANLSIANANDKSLFAAMNGSIPNIAPRGTPTGNFAGVNYDGETDADCWWTWKQCTTPKLPGLQKDVVRCPEPNVWGFTVDDGPNCSHNAYYDYLNSINQKATLFYIGSNVLDWPLEAQRGLDDGHEICAHTWSHRYMTSLSNEQVFAELYYSKKAIKDVLGITVQCWRPPYGDVDDRVRYIAQALGMSTIIWEDNTFDYLITVSNKSYIDANYNAILAKQKAGDYNTIGTIVLSHELNNFTMMESESFLPEILDHFSYAMPVAVCNNNTRPYVEQSGYVYPNFAQWAAGTRSIGIASATAVATDISIPFPIGTGSAGSSVSATIPYATGAATAGATAAATTKKGSGAGVATSGSVGGAAASSSSSSTTKASAASLDLKPVLSGLAVAVGAFIGAAFIL